MHEQSENFKKEIKKINIVQKDHRAEEYNDLKIEGYKSIIDQM